MAPELLNPSGFGLKNSNPTKKSDIYAFGVVTYQVINLSYTLGTATQIVFRRPQDGNRSPEPRMG